MTNDPKSCPRCGGPVTIEAHPSVEGTRVYRCQGKGAVPCKDWGAIVPVGVAPPPEVQAEQQKENAQLAEQGLPARHAAKKKAAKKKKKSKK